MPIRPQHRWLYPFDWPQLSAAIRFRRAKGLCEHCSRPHAEWVHHVDDAADRAAERTIWQQSTQFVALPHASASLFGDEMDDGLDVLRHRSVSTAGPTPLEQYTGAVAGDEFGRGVEGRAQPRCANARQRPRRTRCVAPKGRSGSRSTGRTARLRHATKSAGISGNHDDRRSSPTTGRRRR